MNRRPAFALSFAILALGLAPAFAQGTGSAPARAKVEEQGALEGLARSTGLGSKPVEPAGFVRDSRPADMNYIPVHSKRPEAPGKLLTAEELQAKERELDALKANHDAIAKRSPGKVAYKPLEAPGRPKGAGAAAPAPQTPPLQAAPLKTEGPTLR